MSGPYDGAYAKLPGPTSPVLRIRLAHLAVGAVSGVALWLGWLGWDHAKIDGWRPDLVTPPQVFSALEVAYDAETAQRMWQENVPPDLPAREGEPVRPGVYADLASVDFNEQAVALWSGGQSGSCPGWLSEVRLDQATHVVVTEDSDSGFSGACSSDRNVYRTVVVIDREQLPAQQALASAHATGDEVDYPAEVFLAAYPAP